VTMLTSEFAEDVHPDHPALAGALGPGGAYVVPATRLVPSPTKRMYRLHSA